jgi:proteasome lid subunit RPN8/RPN11
MTRAPSDARSPRAPLAIPHALLESIYAHAQATFPDECCGYLVGPRGNAGVDGVIACHNAQRDGEHPTHPERGAESGFVIAGAELLAFARTFSGERPARIVYHSHPNGRAYFSAIDRAVAADDSGPHYPVEHLVVGITAAGPTEAARFAWSEEACDFVEVARWRVAAAAERSTDARP